jgi:hypothetical protein
MNMNTKMLMNMIMGNKINMLIEPTYTNELFANKSFEETQIRQALIINADSIGYDVSEDRPERLIKVFMAAVSSYLSKRKIAKADEAVALVIQDTSGIFKFAAIVEYIPNLENPDEPGNWAYTMTFYEEDLKDLEARKTVKKLLAGDEAFKSIMFKAGYDVGGFQFKKEVFMYDASILVTDTILQILDREAIDGQVVDLEMPGYFKASVQVENGEKVFSIVPDGHMKALIKSDIDLDD